MHVSLLFALLALLIYTDTAAGVNNSLLASSSSSSSSSDSGSTAWVISDDEDDDHDISDDNDYTVTVQNDDGSEDWFSLFDFKTVALEFEGTLIEFRFFTYSSHEHTANHPFSAVRNFGFCRSGALLAKRNADGSHSVRRITSDGNYVAVCGLRLHVLVAGLFRCEKQTVFPFGASLVVDHKDGIKDHNNADNLQYLTVQQNSFKSDKNDALLRLYEINGVKFRYGEMCNMPRGYIHMELRRGQSWILPQNSWVPPLLVEEQTLVIGGYSFQVRSFSRNCPVFGWCSDFAFVPSNLYVFSISKRCARIIPNDRYSYPYISSIDDNGAVRTARIHRLVALLFGAPVHGVQLQRAGLDLVVDHINAEEKWNFKIDNLQFMTLAANSAKGSHWAAKFGDEAIVDTGDKGEDAFDAIDRSHKFKSLPHGAKIIGKEVHVAEIIRTGTNRIAYFLSTEKNEDGDTLYTPYVTANCARVATGHGDLKIIYLRDDVPPGACLIQCDQCRLWFHSHQCAKSALRSYNGKFHACPRAATIDIIDATSLFAARQCARTERPDFQEATDSWPTRATSWVHEKKRKPYEVIYKFTQTKAELLARQMPISADVYNDVDEIGDRKLTQLAEVYFEWFNQQRGDAQLKISDERKFRCPVNGDIHTIERKPKNGICNTKGHYSKCSDGALMRHVRTVHDGVTANPRPCPKCDYVAPYPSTLRIHFIGRHTTRRFQCAFGCPHGYTQVGNLGVHLKEKHRHKRKRYIMLALHKDDAKPALPENDTLPHQCELCDWRFPNLNFLAYHIKAKHC